MKPALAIISALALALPLAAQQAQDTQSTTIQMQCRDLASSGNLAPGEILISGQACRQVVKAQSSGSATGSSPQPEEQGPAEAPSPAATPAPRGFLLEDGTPVHLVLSSTISSATAQTGDTVEFEVADDVIVNDMVVIPRGATAWATVTDAEHKRHFGKPGKLDINIDKVRLADGEKALLRAVKDVQGAGHTGAMTGAMVATSLVVWPAAPLFLFMHGKDVTIPEGTAITAFVQGDVRLDTNDFKKELVIAN